MTSLMDVKKIFLQPINRYYDPIVCGLTAQWFVVIYLLSFVPVGSLMLGPSLSNGKKQMFRCNGELHEFATERKSRSLGQL